MAGESQRAEESHAKLDRGAEIRDHVSPLDAIPFYDFGMAYLARGSCILAFFSTRPPSPGAFGCCLCHFEWFPATPGLRSGRPQLRVTRPTPLGRLRAAPSPTYTTYRTKP
ncbi:hypothetical protein RSOLAG1IB_08198 [Rhizoctonia solani AG-1 IB]|uniref:Uncharacterized protein n=1 Tax=Thanatephorus cucumeris (strain AG1-IB / isolate 7/3/14) TaxID=1108050 RepID=A0A0B7FH09_THACB|nr:hypothetical protein RSOLAG1IB_08198 [Rhizoctonia solani AG-1 IB]